MKNIFDLVCSPVVGDARVLTDKDDHEQAGGFQLHVGIAEGVAEGAVDDHEEDGAADGAERRLPALQTLPQEAAADLLRGNTRENAARLAHKVSPPAYLTHDERHHHRHEELREDGAKGHGG